MNHRVTVVQFLLLSCLGAACARAVYTCVNELDVPGACPPDTVKHGAFAAATDSVAGADSVIGYVRTKFSGSAVANARVTIVSDTSVTVLTDTSGRFAVLRPPTRSWIVRATMIGYRPRIDTVQVANLGAQTRRIHLEVGLEAQGTDGPCSGFSMFCKKRP